MLSHRVRWCVFVVMAGALLSLNAITLGQQNRSYVPGATAPAAAPANEQAQARETAPATVPLDNGYRQTYYPETYYSDYGTGYPAVEVRAVPPAMAVAAVARAEFRRSQSVLDVMIITMKKTFERTRDWINAINEEREAWEAYEAARRQALKSVMDDPSYQAAVSLRQSLAEQIEQLRGQKYVTKEQIHAMAQVKMGYSATATAMESAALAASPEVQQARERLRRASARLSELRYQLDQAIRNSPDLQVARQSMTDRRIAKVGAEAYLRGVKEARDIALDYAYWSHRYDLYKYLSYGHYGYYYPRYGSGYGNGFGYPIGWTGGRY